jgi:hypothetical protein
MTHLSASAQTTFAARALGAGMARRLRATDFGGRVHSVFSRAVNVEWHMPGASLLTLHGPAPLAAPFGMALEAWPDEHPSRAWGLEPGLPVFARAGHLVAGELEVDWSCARVTDLRVTPCAGEARTARDRLAGALTDLDGPHGAAGLASTPGRAARGAAARAIRERDPAALARAARSLMGLGEGLTPAGDDWLVGALAALHRLAQRWALTGGRLDSVLVGEAQLRTTTIGAAFLAHALAGEFSEPIRDLMTAESSPGARASAARLAVMGATSGADTLAGIRAALRELGAPRS